MRTSVKSGRRPQKPPKIKSEPARPRIEPGLYEAVCYDATVKPGYHGSPTVYVNFRIYGGEHHDTELFMSCPACHSKLRQRHKLYKQWALALGRQPTGNEPFTPEVFVEKLYLVNVRDTQIRQFTSTKLLPDFMQYSIVETIEETLTGVAVNK